MTRLSRRWVERAGSTTGWLAAERVSIGEVAARLGYDSEPSFSRAFKRIVGKPPGALRHDAARGRGAAVPAIAAARR